MAVLTFQFKGKMSPTRGGRKARPLANVLEGSVRTRGGHKTVRIIWELIETERWFFSFVAEYDREIKGIFAACR